MKKKRKIEISSHTYKVLERIREVQKESFDDILKRYFYDTEFSKTIYEEVFKENRFLVRLPFSLRLFIIEMIPDTELKFFLRQSGVIKSFQKNRNVSFYEYIQELYGVFQEDSTRKVYLIFKRLGIKSSAGIARRFGILPQKSSLFSFRIHAGRFLEKKEEILSSLPPGMNGIHQGIKCLTFVCLRAFNVDSIISLVEMCKFLARIRISETDFSEKLAEEQERFFTMLQGRKSISLIRCPGLIPKQVSRLLFSKKLRKIALGGCTLTEITFPEELVSKNIHYIFLQNNFVKPILDPKKFPELRVANVSNTSISYENLVNLIKHPNMRKIVAVHVRLNFMENVNVDLRDDYDESCVLQHLSLASTRVDEKICQVIGKYCKNLTCLILSKTNMTDEKMMLFNLQEMRNLQQINLGWNAIGVDTLKIISKHQTITKLVTPQETLVEEFVDELLSLRNIRQVSFRSKSPLPLTEGMLEKIKNSNLEYLNVIHHNIITKQQIDYIIRHCINLDTFKYSYPDVKDRCSHERPRLLGLL